jgi:hypothetical protein
MPRPRNPERLRLYYNDGETEYYFGTPGTVTYEDRAFTWYPAVELRDHEFCECGHPWLVQVHVIAPDLLPEQAWARVARSAGFSLAEFRALDQDRQIEELVGYGLGLCVWCEEEAPKRELLMQAREKLADVRERFDDYMQRIYNGVGSTGWDVLTDAPFPYQRRTA